MHTTSASLLEQLRHPVEQQPGHDAWARFVTLYTPLLYYWARRLGLQEQDAADLVQDVFTALVQKLPGFQYDQGRSFRGWLRVVLHNKWRDLQRQAVVAHTPLGEEALASLEGPQDADGFSEEEYRKHLVGRALHLMRTEFAPNTWKACWEHVAAGRPADEVAAELGICVGAVYVAKSRVLCRLRQELDGLLD